ncbi:MAG: HEPN domain-containing protein [Muribaculaceae bacterium]|nr:HEPN domain-containing protein [Muribaculaceae bacterium]
MTLKSQERNDIVFYRLERARQTLKEATDIGNLGYWNLAANRLYYAAYYASAALLIHNGIEASSHKGIVRMIGLSFVRQGILKSEDSQLLGRLFTMRQTGDYEDLFDWKESDVKPMYMPVEDYIERIEAIISMTEQRTPSDFVKS